MKFCFAVVVHIVSVTAGYTLFADDHSAKESGLGTWHDAPADRNLDQPSGCSATTLSGYGVGILIAAAPHLPVSLAQVRTWVDRAAEALSAFYGRFPVSGASVLVLAEGDDAVHHGVTYGGRRIVVRLGSATTSNDLAQDWILTHEMFHLGFPDLARQYLWIEEGAACYFEPLVRARAGQLPASRLWHDLIAGAAQGQPEAGDRGLDRTHTWGRTYWGGTLFWLLADLDIRNRTSYTHSADDVLRGLLACGMDGSTPVQLHGLLVDADRFTGVDALTALHDRQGEHADTVDLARIWRRLGISTSDGNIHFDESAEWADLRRSMSMPNRNWVRPGAK